MQQELIVYLNELADRFNTPDFIEDDPISIPHLFENREDIEIAGFLAATISWGNRKYIVRNARRLMRLLEDEPYRFVMESSEREKLQVASFTHRTFNGIDCLCYLSSLERIYKRHHGIGSFFELQYTECGDIRKVISRFRKIFFDSEHPSRTEKHFSSIDKGAACKRLNMYIKWMARKDDRGVDFGLWGKIPPAALFLPLDVHTARTGRMLGLLTRKQNDWKAVEEITAALRELDPLDPVKYDFALFGAGVNHIL